MMARRRGYILCLSATLNANHQPYAASTCQAVLPLCFWLSGIHHGLSGIHHTQSLMCTHAERNLDISSDILLDVTNDRAALTSGCTRQRNPRHGQTHMTRQMTAWLSPQDAEHAVSGRLDAGHRRRRHWHHERRMTRCRSRTLADSPCCRRLVLGRRWEGVARECSKGRHLGRRDRRWQHSGLHLEANTHARTHTSAPACCRLR